MARHMLLTGLVCAVIVWAGGLGIAEASEQGYANPRLIIETGELARILSSYEGSIVDLRPVKDYRQAHLPNAVHLSVAELTATVAGLAGMMAPQAVVEQRLGERGISRQTPLTLYDDADGLLAARLFWILDSFGHREVRLLNGGWAKWRREGRSITRLAPKVVPTRYQAELNPLKVATADWILARIGRPEVVLVDARSPEEFRGEVAGRQVQRAGRIPGAVNVDWRENLTGTSKVVKSASELRRLYEKPGVTADREVVVYCRTGVRAAFDYFVLRLLGYSRVRNYDGSWLEWGNRSDLPAERG
ncbi:MAG: sulfurtransferase [Anaerolineae bacterium]